MPIYHGSDSEHWVSKGMNLAWRDVARHRSEPTFRQGPSTKAKPYAAPYMTLLARGEAPLLTGGGPLFLPAPDAVEIVNDEPRVLAPRTYAHVLPMPLIDRVMATSRASLSEPSWYPSTLRIKWAERELAKADEAAAAGSYHDAAGALADVFGTLLAGFLASRDAPANLRPFINAELEMFRKAWAGLSMFVDSRFFLENLLLALSGHTPSDEADLSLIARMCPRTKIEKPVGTPELVAAEQLADLEKQIKAFEDRLAQAGLPVGTGEARDFEFYSWKVEGVLRFRIASPCFEFTKRSVVYPNSRPHARRAVWIFDRDRKNKLKVFEWPAQVEELVLKKIRARTTFNATATADYPRDFILKVVAVKMGDTTRFKVELSESVKEAPLTPAETKQLSSANRERLVGYFNGRFQALEQLAKLKQSYEVACRKYLRSFDATQEATNGGR